MLEAAFQALFVDYPAVTAAAIVAGIVRGFSGFGTALVYLPFAAQVSPVFALTTMIVIDLVAPLIHVPRAIRDGNPPDVLRLGAGCLLTLPIGIWALTVISPEVFRWGVSIVSLSLIALLLVGLRYNGAPTKPMIYGTGAVGGVLCGSVGLPGPPAVLLYMASSLPSATIRANTTMFLILADVMLLGAIWWIGYLDFAVVGVGFALITPYLLGNWVGAKLFRPGRETLYRAVAYMIVVASALYAMPVWD